ncbi:MAG: aminodeoxychorismate synthase, component I, partial [Candidatus Electrothrix sp. AR4]|nr:aminodeoxychorismate synthase, component I [Candidatus Electrothrix sp. AR4]
PDFQLIETLLFRRDNAFFLLDYHLDRLEDSARYFHFSYDAECVRLQLDQEAQKIQKAFEIDTNLKRWRVRLLLHRDGRTEITSVPLPKEMHVSAPLKVILSRHQVEANNPYLQHKTTRRDLYNREYALASEQGCYEVLFFNTDGEITEGAVSNIFLQVKEHAALLTPPVGCGLLAGTYRRMLLEQGRAVERVLTVDDVLSARKVYVANSVRGLVRVRLVISESV